MYIEKQYVNQTLDKQFASLYFSVESGERRGDRVFVRRLKKPHTHVHTAARTSQDACSAINQFDKISQTGTVFASCSPELNFVAMAGDGVDMEVATNDPYMINIPDDAGQSREDSGQGIQLEDVKEELEEVEEEEEEWNWDGWHEWSWNQWSESWSNTVKPEIDSDEGTTAQPPLPLPPPPPPLQPSEPSRPPPPPPPIESGRRGDHGGKGKGKGRSKGYVQQRRGHRYYSYNASGQEIYIDTYGREQPTLAVMLSQFLFWLPAIPAKSQLPACSFVCEHCSKDIAPKWACEQLFG